MIYEYEKRHDFRYEWIVKLRLDSYWSAPIPTRYERGVYTVPYGNNCGGVNDKLGVADRGTAMSAGLKLSILPALHAVGDRSLWPEALFESHLEMQHTLPVPANFSFCLIDHRKWPFPPEGWHLSIPSLASVGPLNGAYCRPCQPKVESQEQSAAIVESLCKRSGWFPTQGMSSFSLCDATKLEWEDGWEDVFDRAAGKEAAEARRRMSRRKKPFPDCVSDVTMFKERCQVWDAPTPHQICTVKSQNPWPKATPTSS